jgi:hypothetical protein
MGKSRPPDHLPPAVSKENFYQSRPGPQGEAEAILAIKVPVPVPRREGVDRRWYEVYKKDPAKFRQQFKY